MIYALIFWEFLQIGLFAVGGGLVTVPFLFDLASKYAWFSNQELTDMIAVAQALPGPVGINIAAYAGFYTAGWGGGILAPLSEVLPAMAVVYLIARIMNKWQENRCVQRVLRGIRPAVLALVLYAAWMIGQEVNFNPKTAALFVFILAAMHFYQRNVVLYIVLSAIVGVALQI